MPLDRLVLIIVAVLAAAGATVWIAGVLFASFSLSPTVGLLAAIPVGLAAYIAFRIIADRVASKEDDHYDRFDN